MTTSQVRVYRPGRGRSDTTQTSGMQREELVASPRSWVGVARTEPGFVSGWHHHADYDTYVYVTAGKVHLEFGHGGSEHVTASAGDVVHVPRETVHRESNPSDELQVLFVVRVGQGEPVVNLDGPEEGVEKSAEAPS